MIIDNKVIEITEGETIIESARRSGIEIPSLCYKKGAIHKSSCMVCAVLNKKNGQIIPSCSTLADDSMEIESSSEEVAEIRKSSLELLLSDHRADCLAPCNIACPGAMDVAQMNRLIEGGKQKEALALLRDTLVIPATLCYICNAPCENICRKKALDGNSVAIREIKKQLVLSTDIDVIKNPSNGIKIAVRGSSPAGLSAAWRLNKLGYEVTVFEQNSEILSSHIDISEVDSGIITKEINEIEKAGVTFITSHSGDIEDFRAIVSTTNEGGDFVLTAKAKQPARLVLEGNKLALEVDASLSGRTLAAHNKPFNSSYPKFTDSEKEIILSYKNLKGEKTDCLFCDCDKKTRCLLRDYASTYDCKGTLYGRNNDITPLQREHVAGRLWYEKGKCIKCGLCVYNTNDGFTFKDRGFVMEVMIDSLCKQNVAEQIELICPTGALFLRDV